MDQLLDLILGKIKLRYSQSALKELMGTDKSYDENVNMNEFDGLDEDIPFHLRMLIKNHKQNKEKTDLNAADKDLEIYKQMFALSEKIEKKIENKKPFNEKLYKYKFRLMSLRVTLLNDYFWEDRNRTYQLPNESKLCYYLFSLSMLLRYWERQRLIERFGKAYSPMYKTYSYFETINKGYFTMDKGVDTPIAEWEPDRLYEAMVDLNKFKQWYFEFNISSRKAQIVFSLYRDALLDRLAQVLVKQFNGDYELLSRFHKSWFVKVADSRLINRSSVTIGAQNLSKIVNEYIQKTTEDFKDLNKVMVEKEDLKDPEKTDLNGTMSEEDRLAMIKRLRENDPKIIKLEIARLDAMIKAIEIDDDDYDDDDTGVNVKVFRKQKRQLEERLKTFSVEEKKDEEKEEEGDEENKECLVEPTMRFAYDIMLAADAICLIQPSYTAEDVASDVLNIKEVNFYFVPPIIRELAFFIKSRFVDNANSLGRAVLMRKARDFTLQKYISVFERANYRATWANIKFTPGQILYQNRKQAEIELKNFPTSIENVLTIENPFHYNFLEFVAYWNLEQYLSMVNIDATVFCWDATVHMLSLNRPAFNPVHEWISVVNSSWCLMNCAENQNWIGANDCLDCMFVGRDIFNAVAMFFYNMDRTNAWALVDRFTGEKRLIKTSEMYMIVQDFKKEKNITEW